MYEAIGIGAGCLTYPITATVRFPTLCVWPAYLGLLPSCTNLHAFSTINFLALHVHVVMVAGPVHLVLSCKCFVDGKTFKKPRRPFEKERLDGELKLVGEYGLRNKRELWRVQMALSKMRQAARTLLTEDEVSILQLLLSAKTVSAPALHRMSGPASSSIQLAIALSAELHFDLAAENRPACVVDICQEAV